MGTLVEIASHVENWLHGEHAYQFSKFDAMYGDELQSRRDFIAQSEIPNKWQRNVVLRTGASYLLANQQLLKVCAAARAVVVYNACIAGDDRSAASDHTFHDLKEYFSSLSEQDILGPEILYQPFELAFPSNEPSVCFRRAGLLAIAGLRETEQLTGIIDLPRPGVSSGQV